MNSAPWINVVTPAAYHELSQLVLENPPINLNESVLTESTNYVNSWNEAGVTALSHGTGRVAEIHEMKSCPSITYLPS